MRGEVTEHEHQQILQSRMMTLASSWRLDEQAVYRMCPDNQYVSECHFKSVLANPDGTHRYNNAVRRVTVGALASQGLSAERIAATLAYPLSEVHEHLRPLQYWKEGKERLDAIEAEKERIRKLPRMNPPESDWGSEYPHANANADGVRTMPGAWRNSGGRENVPADQR